jgi:hypothetical protein
MTQTGPLPSPMTQLPSATSRPSPAAHAVLHRVLPRAAQSTPLAGPSPMCFATSLNRPGPPLEPLTKQRSDSAGSIEGPFSSCNSSFASLSGHHDETNSLGHSLRDEMANSFSSRKDENSFSSLREAAALRAAALREEARKEAAPPPLLSATSRADPEPPRPTPLKNEGRGSSRVAWADKGQNDARVAAAQVGSPSSVVVRRAARAA